MAWAKFLVYGMLAAKASAFVLLWAIPWLLLASVSAGVFVLFAIHFVVCQESYIYLSQPSRKGGAMPSDRQLEFEDVYLETGGGIRIHAWFIPAQGQPSQAPTILYCHSYSGNVGLRVPFFAKMSEMLQANIFALDYRGYGNSEGAPSEDGLIEDALTAWSWLRSRADEGRIDGRRTFVFGSSLGGAVTVGLASALALRGEQTQPRGLVLENTFTSLGALADARCRHVWVCPAAVLNVLKGLMLRIHWDTGERIKNVEASLLFLTGMKDQFVPPSHSAMLLELAEKAPLRRQACFLEGTHSNTWQKSGDEYWEAILEFMAECAELAPEQ